MLAALRSIEKCLIQQGKCSSGNGLRWDFVWCALLGPLRQWCQARSTKGCPPRRGLRQFMLLCFGESEAY